MDIRNLYETRRSVKELLPITTVEQSRKVNHWKTLYAKATFG